MTLRLSPTARYCAARAIAFDLPYRARRTAAHDIGSESQAPNAHRPRAGVEITVNFIDIKAPIDVDAAVTCGRSEFQLLLPNFRPVRLVGSANPVSIGLVSTLFHPTVQRPRTALNSRAGILCSLIYSRFSDTADRPAATSTNSFRCTSP